MISLIRENFSEYYEFVEDAYKVISLSKIEGID